MKGKRIWPFVLVTVALCFVLVGCGCTATDAKPNNTTANNGTNSSGTVADDSANPGNVDGTTTDNAGNNSTMTGDTANPGSGDSSVTPDTEGTRNRRVADSTVDSNARNAVNDVVRTGEDIVGDATRMVRNGVDNMGRAVEDMTGYDRNSGRAGH